MNKPFGFALVHRRAEPVLVWRRLAHATPAARHRNERRQPNAAFEVHTQRDATNPKPAQITRQACRLRVIPAPVVLRP
jgi:hypothetical protein